jgi:hypothetical protein
VLEADLMTLVEHCISKLGDVDGSSAFSGRLALVVTIRAVERGAVLESVGYAGDGDVDDSRLPECIEDVLAGEILAREVLDVLEDGRFTLRVENLGGSPE